LLAVVGAVVVLASKVMTGPGQHSSDGGDNGLRILDERYARGEIDREEYEERRRTIQASRT